MKRILFTLITCLALGAISFAQPVASFTANPTTICVGQSVTWTNTSQNANTYTWSFPGSNLVTSTVQTPNPRTYNTPGVYDVTLIAEDGSGDKDTIYKKNYITVLASPTITITPGVGAPNGYAYVGCSITSVTLTAQGGSTYKWSPATALSSTTGATVVASPTTNTTYNVVGTNANGCTAQTSIIVEYNTAPPPDSGPITGPSLVCSGQVNVSYIAPPVNSPSTPYRNWTVPPGAVITSGQGTRNNFTVTFGSTSGNVCCTLTNACGASIPACMSVTVNPTPAVDTVGAIYGPVSVCANQSGISYSVAPVTNATSYTWTVPGGAIITSGASTNVIVVSFSTTPGNVCVRAGNSCSSTQQACQAVTISPNAPAIPGTITGSTTVCNGQAGVIYSVPFVAGNPTYSWTVPTGATITAGQGARTFTVTFGSASGDICVTAGNACGTSLPRCLTITVNPAASVGTLGNITGPVAICANQSGITYSISAVANATSYTWTVPTGSVITAGQNTNVISMTFSTTPGNVCVRAGNSCNTSQPKCVAVSVSPSAPAIPGTMTGPGSVCNGATGVTYSVPFVAGSPTYSWTVPSGSTITGGQGSRTVTVTFGGTSGDICVTVGNACGTSLPRCMTLTVSPSSAVDSVGLITGPVGICANQSSVSYSVSPVPNATSYTWTVPNGASITAGQNTNIISVTFSTTPGNICVRAGNSCNNTQPRCITVTVSPNAPSIPGAITGLTNVCSSQAAVSYSIAAVTNATSYSWTVPAGSTITAGQGSRFLTVTFGNTTGDVCVSASNACGTSLPKCLTITVNPTAAVDSVGIITGPVSACANQGSVVYSVAAVANATSYTWTVPGSITINSGQGTSSISVTFAGTGGNICVVAGNSCNTSKAECISVSVAPNAPGIPGTINGQAALCEGETAHTYSVIAVPNASTYSWTVPAGSTITAGQGTNKITVSIGSTSGNLCVTAGNGCGTSLPKCVTLTVTPLPVMDVSPLAPSICQNGSVFLTASGATSYVWSPATGLSATTGSTVTASPANTTPYTVTGTSSGCANTATVTVKVNVCTGIVNAEKNSDIHIYPNPANEFLFIEGTFASNGKVQVTMINMFGQKVMSREVEVNGTLHEKVNVTELPAGVYFIEISSAETSSTSRFIKQ